MFCSIGKVIAGTCEPQAEPHQDQILSVFLFPPLLSAHCHINRYQPAQDIYRTASGWEEQFHICGMYPLWGFLPPAFSELAAPTMSDLTSYSTQHNLPRYSHITARTFPIQWSHGCIHIPFTAQSLRYGSLEVTTEENLASSAMQLSIAQSERKSALLVSNPDPNQLG